VCSGVELEIEGSRSVTQRIADGVCRRAFSSPEAIAYEMTIAPALARVLAPAIRERFKGGRILDVGCGGGRIAAALSETGAGATIGIDPSRSQVKSFTRRMRNDRSAWAACARAEALPFTDRSFNFVFSSCAWKHWPDPAAGVAECARVTQSEGTVVIIEIDGSSTQTEFERFARTTWFPPGVRAAYVRFAMRTVVGVAPDAHALLDSFRDLPLTPSGVDRIKDSPFLLVEATVP
jgi:ubiquinone/menaquinone biosynthesis C-methylase UbiE